MAASLNNVTTADNYTPATTLYTLGAIKVNIQVYNAAIFYSFGSIPPGGNPRGAHNFRPETFLAPGYYSFGRRCDSIRVRSAKAGVPAQVTIEALDPDD